jgi:chromate reductase, NAD(P)H dehydrogenase (quinone)
VKPIRILGMSGSLRKASFNSATLRVAQASAPDGVTVDIFDLTPLPIQGVGFPAVVQELGEKIRAADALIMVTPEYNYGMSGVLKNAIDWVSRLPNQPFNTKPLGIMGATMGMWGTTRAQYDIRRSSVFLNMFPINKPEVLIAQAQNKFNDKGELTDEATKKLIKEHVEALAAFARKLAA